MLDDLLQTTSSFFEKIDAIIFDCNGILVDSEYINLLAWQTALKSKNIELSCEDYMPLIGYSSKMIFQKIQELKKKEIPPDVIEVRRAVYRALQSAMVAPIKEMVAFVKKLTLLKEKVKLGVASSAPKNELLFNLQKIGLEKSFDVIVSGADDLDSYSDKEGTNKPKPYIYVEAAKKLSVAPSRCLVFEDTWAGIEAATSAGMIAIAIPNHYTKNHDFSKAVKVMPLV